MGRSRRLWLLGGAALVLAAAIAVVVVVAAGGGGGTATVTPTSSTGTPRTPETSTATETSPSPPPTTGERPPPPTTGQRLGASVNILFNTPGAFAPAQIDAQLQALRATGATIARSDALWERAEPSPPVGGVHHYSWDFDDSVAGALAAHRIEWLPIIDYSAPWARPPTAAGHPPPSSVADYAAYAAALAARYGPDGAFWSSHPELPKTPVHIYEIWNEPDNGQFWSPQPSPAAYAELYAQARAAIDAVDPSARVIVGGLTHPGAFIPALIAAAPALRGHIDGVAVHPYGRTPDGVLARIVAARRTLRAVGLGSVPLYVTEFGWTTQPAHTLNWASEARRPAYISRTVTALAHTDCGIAAAILYTWVTAEQDPSSREDWYGIYSPANHSTPDSEAFAAGLRAAAKQAPDIKLCG